MMEDKPKNCYIYCRVSTDRQAKEGYSLDAQKDICSQKAKELHCNVLDIFVDEGETATMSQRDEFMKMLDLCEENKNVDLIIVYNTDRFARNTLDHFLIKEKLRKSGTHLISVVQPMLDDSPEGKLLDTFLAGINQFYSDDLSRKTKRGLQRKWDEGWWPGWAPLGYKNKKKKDDQKGTVIIDKEVGQLIILAFKLYSTGDYSYLKLIKTLHRKGLRTRNGKPIAHSTIQQILTRTFYYGLMKWNGQEKMGKHSPLITKELFDLCQLVASKHRNYVTRERKYDFLLRGVIFCSQCGQRYTAEWHNVNSAKRDKIGYYHCAKLTRCKSHYVESDDLEKQVAEHLKDIKFSKSFTDKVANRIRRYLTDRDREEAKVRKNYLNKSNALLARRKTLESTLLDKTIDRETFKRMHEDLESDISRVDEEIAKLHIGRKFDFDLLEETLALTRNIRKTYLEAPKFLKKKYLNFFFEQIFVNDKKIERTVFSPLVKELIDQQQVILRKDWLPLWDIIRLVTSRLESSGNYSFQVT